MDKDLDLSEFNLNFQLEKSFLEVEGAMEAVPNDVRLIILGYADWITIVKSVFLVSWPYIEKDRSTKGFILFRKSSFFRLSNRTLPLPSHPDEQESNENGDKPDQSTNRTPYYRNRATEGVFLAGACCIRCRLILYQRRHERV